MHYLVWGYYGFDNLGDELMLGVIAARIRERDPGATVSVRCLEAPDIRGIDPFPVEQMIAGRSPLMLIPYMLRIMKKLMEIDVLVIGGGTLFLDKGRHNASMLVLAVICQAARLFGKRIVIIGAGIDTLALGINRLYLKLILSASWYACFRDDHSYNIARSLGTRTQIQRGSDILFDPSFMGRFDTSHLGTHDRVVLSFSDHFRTWHSPERREQLSARIRTLLGTVRERFPGKQIILCAFQQRYGEQDLEYLRSIMTGLPGKDPASEKSVELLVPRSDKDIQDLFGNAAFVIGMRFHALVLSAIFGRPFLGIDIETKIRELCKDFSMPSIGIDEFLARGIDAEDLDRLMSSDPSREHLDRQCRLTAANFSWLEHA
ncbi:MAG: polysaccharide pyruvyl transferase family protein [Nitrospirota bacterium]